MSRNPYILAKRRSRAGFGAVASTTVRPDRLSAIFAEGVVHHQAGRLGEAERIYRRILEQDPAHADSLHLLGMVAMQTGHNDAALELISRAIAGNGDCAAYHRDLGIVLQTQGRLEAAVASYDRAIELRPEGAAAYSNRGVALQFLGRLEEAGSSLVRAVELGPRMAQAHANLGNLRQREGQIEEAVACQRRALAIQPGYAEAWCNLGTALDLQGRTAEALAAFDRAVELKPEFVVARVGRATQRLLMGNFAAGLPEYEHRLGLGTPRRFAQPRWRGEPLADERILLYAEQGLGDTIQFLRYVPMVQAAGGEVMLEVQPQLRRIAEQMPEVTVVASACEALPAFAWHCPLMSLPLALGTAIDSIPAKTPYLFLPPEAVKKAADLTWPVNGLRIGLAWAGNPRHLKDRFRSIPLPVLEPLLRVRGTHFFSLQVGEEAAHLDAAGMEIVDLRPEIEDTADTAALIAQLDLVVAADTSVAHLAGALGKPVWVMLPFAPDWRWLLDREDSPWYPTMRLFRQPRLGDWATVVEQMRKELDSLLARR